MTARKAPPEIDPVTAVIADDEALARRRIIELLDGHPSVLVVGETTSGPATLDAVRALEPDVLFLDVQMPGLSGFEVLSRLEPGERPVVVFSTAFDEYAIQAFEVAAIDYLLKPYADERFDQAVRRAERALRDDRDDRVRERLRGLLDALPAEDGVRSSASPKPYLERFAIPVRGRWVLASATSVAWIEASGDYVTLHADDRSYLLRGTMASVEARLDPGEFLRIHRSTIIRLDRVRGVEIGEHGDYEVVLVDGERLRVSRARRGATLERLGVTW